MSVTHREGNVIHAEFGKQPEPGEPLLSVSCRMLYLDEHIAVARLTYRINGQTLIQHVVRGVGLDA